MKALAIAQHGVAMPPVEQRIQQALNDRSLGSEGLFHSLSLLLSAGGDRRILSDPFTGRNRYGTRTTLAEDEISFASTTASNVSARGLAAAGHELQRLFGMDTPSSVTVDRWFDDLRASIRHKLACGDAEIILAASGTDVELLAICMMAGLSTRPLTNILIAPDETGSGVPLAAAGRHYSDLTALGRPVAAGAPLEGISADRIDVCAISIRNEIGQARLPDEIDADLVAMVERELKRGRDVLVHVLDTSKTGLTGVTRQAARHVRGLAPGRVRVIVDACQYRCSNAAVRQDIADGFMVAVTGSKFIAGPPFAGALLVPGSIAEELGSIVDLPAGLAEYTALYDWPETLRAGIGFAFGSELNLGLGLRWVAALANLADSIAVDDGLQGLIKRQFAQLVRARIGDIDGAFLHPEDDGEHLGSRAIVPMTIIDETGAFASFAQAQSIHLAMREAGEGPVCHLGQAVKLGSRSVLRVAASALDIATVSGRMALGNSLEEAFKPIESNLDIVFAKWAAIRATERRA